MISDSIISNPMFYFFIIFLFFIHIIVNDETILKHSNSSRKIYID